MSREFARTFEVSVGVDRAWHAMTDPDEINQWFFHYAEREDGSRSFEILGDEVAIQVLEAEPHKKLRYARR